MAAPGYPEPLGFQSQLDQLLRLLRLEAQTRVFDARHSADGRSRPAPPPGCLWFVGIARGGFEIVFQKGNGRSFARSGRRPPMAGWRAPCGRLPVSLGPSGARYAVGPTHQCLGGPQFVPVRPLNPWLVGSRPSTFGPVPLNEVSGQACIDPQSLADRGSACQR